MNIHSKVTKDKDKNYYQKGEIFNRNYTKYSNFIIVKYSLTIRLKEYPKIILKLTAKGLNLQSFYEN